MKTKIFLLLLALATISTAFAQSPVSVISGTWEKRAPKTISLFKIENGALAEVSKTTLNAENKFFFAFAPSQPAFYVVGVSPASAMFNYPFYFKPGDNLNVVIDAAANKYTLVGDNTPENKEMARWHDFILPIEHKSVFFSMPPPSTYVDFFPLLEEKLKEANAYKQEYQSDATFNEAFAAYRKFDMLYYALNFAFTPRSAQPTAKDFPAYYRKMDIADIAASDKLLKYPYGMSIVSRYHMLQPLVKADLTEEQKRELRSPMSMLDITLPQIPNDEIKGEVVLMQTNYIKTYEGFLDYENKYSKYLITPSQKERFKSILVKVADNSQGQTAVDLKFADRTGKEVSLSSLKGKVVYIDIWATWCVPCRKEFPFMKKLEAEYQANSNMAFVGISIDATKDKQKWLDFLDKEQLPGIQLFAGDAAQESLKPYKVTTIPRFILIGKDGKLISADAPRPSSDELKVALEAALKK